MGKLFRSEDMDYVQLILQSDACYDAVCELGEWGMVHFSDLNPSVNAFSRTFVKDIRRAEEMERKLRYLAQQMEKGDITESADSLLSYECHLKHAAPSFQEIEELDNKLSQLETEVKEMNDNEANLQRNYLELVELQYIVKLTAQYFDEASRRKSMEGSVPHEEASLLAHEEGTSAPGVNLGYVTGVIHREKFPSFERVMWRGTRGNVYMRHVDIAEQLRDPATGEMMDKVVFVAFFQGEVLANKVKRICDGFGATCYPCPESYAERKALAQRVSSSIEELQMVLSRTDEFRKRVLSDIADNYEEWYVKGRKMKAAFHTMNKFSTDVSSAALIGEGWVPSSDIDTLRDRLTKVTERLGNGVPAIVKIMNTRASPPTYHVTNKYTFAFQAIVDAYGVATYQEVNPGLWTIISFPFLFAVMFGDVGHGILMAMAAGYMVYKEDSMLRDRSKGEIMETIFGGRYIILLMGLFSIYTGWVYNDFFAKNVWVFNSGWKTPTKYYDGSLLLNVTGLTYNDQCPEGCGYTGSPYPFGVDPIWGLSGNKLSFLNSLKMKMSVLLGVLHMGWGVILTNFNYIHHKHLYGIWAEFIPQALFLFGVFGYLCGMIIAKWCMVFPSILLEDGTLQPTDPSILVSLVNMFLNPGVVDYKSKTVLYEGQAKVQNIIVCVALICIPWMLCAKPLYLKSVHSKPAGYEAVNGDEEAAEKHGGGHGHDEEFNFGDIVVDNSIHTIEFVLGAVSNTASYLRLWALSLAHAQLAEVLWDMVLKPTFSMNAFGLFFGFGAWAVLSVGVLLLMEGMSAFLHALRLHWVEFQNKFYKGEGYAFMPFNFRDSVEGVEE